MNKEQTLAAIAVMQAYVDGEVIQVCSRGDNDWETLEGGVIPAWEWSLCSYRIKPEPREYWLVRNSNLDTYGVCGAEPMGGWNEIIHVREIIE